MIHDQFEIFEKHNNYSVSTATPSNIEFNSISNIADQVLIEHTRKFFELVKFQSQISLAF